MSSIQNLPSPVRTYIEARSSLHQKISSEHLLGSHATLEDDQVTLHADLQVGDKSYKAGSTYSLNPYSNRDASRESLSYSDGKASVVIRHEYAPAFFSAQESLNVDTRGQSNLDFGTFGLNDTNSGIKPDGWLQKDVKNVDGFILSF